MQVHNRGLNIRRVSPPLLIIIGLLTGGIILLLVAGSAGLAAFLEETRVVTHPWFRIDAAELTGLLLLLQKAGLAALLLGLVYGAGHLRGSIRLPAASGTRKRKTRPSITALLLANPPAALASLLVAFIGAGGIWLNSIEFLGTRYFVLVDDAMISMRYARNLAAGDGLIWNIGERVEGYTNLLWTLVMALVHLPGIPEAYTSLVVMLINWALLIGILWLVSAVLRRLGVGSVWQYVTLLLLALDQNLIHWTFSGFETTLTAFLAMLSLWALLAGRTRLFAVALALLPLTRSDAGLIALLLGLLYLWEQRATPRPAVLLLALTTLPAVGQIVFRLAYYGDLLPNTYFQKMSPQIDERTVIGLSYALRLFDYLLPLALLLVAVFLAGVDRRLRWLAAAVGAQIAYMIYAGGDAFQDLRFFAPVVPFVYLCAGAAADRLTSGARPLAVGLLAGLMIAAAPLARHDSHLLALEPSPAELQWTVLAQIIDANTPPDTRILVTGAGTIPYFLEEYSFIDGLGLNDRHIARLEPPFNGIWLGHNKFDYTYVYDQRQPDLVVTTFDCFVTLERLSMDDDERRARLQNDNRATWASAELWHPTFASAYATNPILIYTPRGAILNPGFCLFWREGNDGSRLWTYDGAPLSSVALDFDFPFINGAGWGRAQVNDNNVSYRLLRDESAVLTLPPLRQDAGYLLRFRVALDPADAEQLSVRFNGQTAALARLPDTNPQIGLFQAVIPPAWINADAPQRLVFDVPGRGGDVTFDWLRLDPPE
jgi:hypothetical protein